MRMPDWKSGWLIQRIIILSVLILVFNTVFSAFFLKRQEKEIAALDEKAAYYSQILSGRASPEGTQTEATEFINSLPDHGRITKILDFIFIAARNNNLRIPSGDYNPEELKDSSLARYAFTFPVEGHYRDIKRFIYEMESSDYPLAIEELILTKGKAENSQIALDVKMSILYR